VASSYAGNGCEGNGVIGRGRLGSRYNTGEGGGGGGGGGGFDDDYDPDDSSDYDISARAVSRLTMSLAPNDTNDM
jgi:hypothetical protein